MTKVKLSSILETLKQDYINWNELLKYLEDIYDGDINKEELELKVLPSHNNRLLFVKFDNAKYLIFDIDTFMVYKTCKAVKIFERKFFSLFLNDITKEEEFKSIFKCIDSPKNKLVNILNIYINKDEISHPVKFTLPVNDELNIDINVLTGVVKYRTLDNIEVSDFNLQNKNELVDDYDIDVSLIPRYIQDRKVEFNPDYERKYGYKK